MNTQNIQLSPKQEFYLKNTMIMLALFFSLTIAFSGILKYALLTGVFLLTIIIVIGHVDRRWDPDYPRPDQNS